MTALQMVMWLAGILAGLIHVLIFCMESVWWSTPSVRARFRQSPDQAEATRLFAFNQGFYNLFLALGVFAGLTLVLAGHAVSGLTLATWSCLSMLGAAIVLVASAPTMKRGALIQGAAPLLFLLLAISACASADRAPGGGAYVPRTRSVTITTVPLLVKEAQSVYPFLRPAFAKGGVLEGKEVYAFSPSTITVIEGDTLRLTLINPEDDAHSFVLPDFAVPIPPGKTTQATYVARHAGVFTILCAVPSHLPMMTGQLVVLPARMMAER